MRAFALRWRSVKDMKSRRSAVCACCGKVGQPRHLNEFLESDKWEPIIVLCNQCIHALRYADAKTWKWLREYRDRQN